MTRAAATVLAPAAGVDCGLRVVDFLLRDLEG